MLQAMGWRSKTWWPWWFHYWHYYFLDLPERVAAATRDLPDHVLKECFSNILITGKQRNSNAISVILNWKLKIRVNLDSWINVILFLRRKHGFMWIWQTSFSRFTRKNAWTFSNNQCPSRYLWRSFLEYCLWGIYSSSTYTLRYVCWFEYNWEVFYTRSAIYIGMLF